MESNFWYTAQGLKGGDDNNTDTHITAIAGSETQMVAGDFQGQLILFEINSDGQLDFKCETSAFTMELDIVKQYEVPTQVTVVDFIQQSIIMAANEKHIRCFEEKTVDSNATFGKGRKIQTALEQTMQVSNMHQFHINSVVFDKHSSLLSSDELTCNLWPLEDPQRFTTIVDKTPPQISELSEILTSAFISKFDPNIVCVTTSTAQVENYDIRTKSRQQILKVSGESTTTHFVLTSAITSADFLDANTVASRDYLGVRLWDLRTQQQVDYIKTTEPDLTTAYQTNKIFDRLKVQCHGSKIMTSGYGQQLTIVDDGKLHALSLASGQAQMNRCACFDRADYKASTSLNGLANQMAWSPSGKRVFAASLSSLFMFQNN